MTSGSKKKHRYILKIIGTMTILAHQKAMHYKILDQKGLNFLTCTIVEWIDLFTRPVYCDIVIDSLRFCQREKGLVVHGFVLMSSHLHLIVRAEGDENNLSEIIRSFKSHTARQIIKYIQNHRNPESRREWLLSHFAFNARRNQTNSEHQVWQGDNHPIILYSPQVIRQKLIYIHDNPIKAKIVAMPEHYLLSSASNYAFGTGILNVTILDDIWNDTGYVRLGPLF